MLNSFRNLLDNTTSAISSAVSGHSEEHLLYCKAYAAVLTLVTSADFEFEAKEFEGASKFLETDAVLSDNALTLTALDLFRKETAAIKKVMKEGNIEFPSVQTELIIDVRKCPEEFEDHLRGVISQLRGMSENERERSVIDRINL